MNLIQTIRNQAGKCISALCESLAASSERDLEQWLPAGTSGNAKRQGGYHETSAMHALMRQNLGMYLAKCGGATELWLSELANVPPANRCLSFVRMGAVCSHELHTRLDRHFRNRLPDASVDQFKEKLGEQAGHTSDFDEVLDHKLRRAENVILEALRRCPSSDHLWRGYRVVLQKLVAACAKDLGVSGMERFINSPTVGAGDAQALAQCFAFGRQSFLSSLAEVGKPS